MLKLAKIRLCKYHFYMKTIVIYNSQTGFTKKYAEWISEACNCQCFDLKKCSKINLSTYDAIIFGGWFMAGAITKIEWFKKQIPSLAATGKKLIIYAVGASPAGSPEISREINKNLSESELSKVKIFYCPGGFNYDKMSLPSKLAMKMFVKMLKSKKGATEEEIKRADTLSKSYDISDKKYIEPILSALK